MGSLSQLNFEWQSSVIMQLLVAVTKNPALKKRLKYGIHILNIV